MNSGNRGSDLEIESNNNYVHSTRDNASFNNNGSMIYIYIYIVLYATTSAILIYYYCIYFIYDMI